MDSEFKDITKKDTIEHRNIFRITFDFILTLFLLFAIFSLIITVINIENIKNDKSGYLIHKKTIIEKTNYVITDYNYLIYKIVRIDDTGGRKCYFRFWFMDSVRY